MVRFHGFCNRFLEVNQPSILDQMQWNSAIFWGIHLDYERNVALSIPFCPFFVLFGNMFHDLQEYGVCNGLLSTVSVMVYDHASGVFFEFQTSEKLRDFSYHISLIQDSWTILGDLRNRFLINRPSGGEIIRKVTEI